MTEMESNEQNEFAGFEDVVAFIEGMAVPPAESVHAAQVRMAAAAASERGIRLVGGRPRPERPTVVRAFRRGAVALVAALLGVSGLAVAGVLPEDAQNAVAGVAQLMGVNLPNPSASSLSTTSDTDTDPEISEEDSTTAPDQDQLPSQQGDEDEVDEDEADEDEGEDEGDEDEGDEGDDVSDQGDTEDDDTDSGDEEDDDEPDDSDDDDSGSEDDGDDEDDENHDDEETDGDD